MTVNVVLARWDGGWQEIRDDASIASHGRHEALLVLGTVSSPDEMDRIARRQLAIFANPRMAIAADHAPHGRGDRPFFDYNVGDTITVPAYGGGTISQRVRAISGAEDDNGEITYSPELGDLILEAQERELLTLKKMADGTFDGESPVATPRTMFVNENEWGSGPLPGGGGLTGFTVETAASVDALNTSQLLRSVPPGDGTYTLTSMWCVPDTDGTHDGVGVSVELWQVLPSGEGSYAAAAVHMGQNFQAGVQYGATIGDNTIQFAPDFGIEFHIYGDRTGTVHTYAEFEGGGVRVTVAWTGPSLRVSHEPT